MFACMPMYVYTHVQVYTRVCTDHIHSDAHGSQRRALMEGCEPPCGCKKPNLGLLGKQQSLLTSDLVSPKTWV